MIQQSLSVLLDVIQNTLLFQCICPHFNSNLTHRLCGYDCCNRNKRIVRPKSLERLTLINSGQHLHFSMLVLVDTIGHNNQHERRTEVVGADLQGAISSHEQTDVSLLFVFQELHITCATFLPLWGVVFTGKTVQLCTPNENNKQTGVSVRTTFTYQNDYSNKCCDPLAF